MSIPSTRWAWFALSVFQVPVFVASIVLAGLQPGLAAQPAGPESLQTVLSTWEQVRISKGWPTLEDARKLPDSEKVKIARTAFNYHETSARNPEVGFELLLSARLSRREVILEIAKGITKFDHDFDPATARRIYGLLGREAMRGSSNSVVARAVMMEKGMGIPKNPEEAYDWYVWGARVGNSRASEKLFNARLLGIGTEVDPEGAREALIQKFSPERQLEAIRDTLRGFLARQDAASVPLAETYALRAMSAVPEHAMWIALEIMRQDTVSDAIRNIAMSRLGEALSNRDVELVWNEDMLEDVWDIRQPEFVADLVTYLTSQIEGGKSQAVDLLATGLGEAGSPEMSEVQEKIRTALVTSAESGNVTAAVALARDLTLHQNVPDALERAYGYWKFAAGKGHPEALLQYGLLRLKTQPDDTELREIRQMLETSAGAGFTMAEAALMRLGN